MRSGSPAVAVATADNLELGKISSKIPQGDLKACKVEHNAWPVRIEITVVLTSTDCFATFSDGRVTPYQSDVNGVQKSHST